MWNWLSREVRKICRYDQNIFMKKICYKPIIRKQLRHKTMYLSQSHTDYEVVRFDPGYCPPVCECEHLILCLQLLNSECWCRGMSHHSMLYVVLEISLPTQPHRQRDSCFHSRSALNVVGWCWGADSAGKVLAVGARGLASVYKPIMVHIWMPSTGKAETRKLMGLSGLPV